MEFNLFSSAWINKLELFANDLVLAFLGGFVFGLFGFRWRLGAAFFPVLGSPEIPTFSEPTNLILFDADTARVVGLCLPRSTVLVFGMLNLIPLIRSLRRLAGGAGEARASR